MQVIYYYLMTSFVVGTVSAECHACFARVCYTKQKLFEAAQLSGQLAIDRKTNLLHFHYKDIRSDDYTAILNLNSVRTDVRFLPLSYSFARAMNQATGDVYMSGQQGIYVYDSMTKQTHLYGLQDKIIWHMQYKNRLYYVEYQKPGLYYIDNNMSYLVEELSSFIIDDFIVDKYDDIYFTSEYAVYRFPRYSRNATLFSTILYSLVTDKDDNAYFIQTGARTLYRLDYENDRLQEIGIIDSGNIFRAVFDNVNNLIYSDANDDKIYYLYPNYKQCEITSNDTTTQKPSMYYERNRLV